MCGRIFIKEGGTSGKVLSALGLGGVLLDRNNLAPTESVPVIFMQGDTLKMRDMRWWLHPFWEKEPPHQKQARFNARIETVLTLNSYRVPIKKQRAIVPIDAFVEWQKEGNVKLPWYIEGKTEPLAIAAIWDVWGDEIYSCAIITQPASESFLPIHDRMPVSLSLHQAKRWIDAKENAADLITEFGHSSVDLKMQRISTEVNNARNKQLPIFIN